MAHRNKGIIRATPAEKSAMPKSNPNASYYSSGSYSCSAFLLVPSWISSQLVNGRYRPHDQTPTIAWRSSVMVDHLNQLGDINCPFHIHSSSYQFRIKTFLFFGSQLRHIDGKGSPLSTSGDRYCSPLNRHKWPSARRSCPVHLREVSRRPVRKPIRAIRLVSQVMRIEHQFQVAGRTPGQPGDRPGCRRL